MADLIVFAFVIVVVVAFGVKAIWHMLSNTIHHNRRK
jgi:hypothetical protein